MRTVRIVAMFLLLIGASVAQQAKPAANPTGLVLPADLPDIPLFDVSAMDKSVDACVDFYKYACGGWMAKNPVPPDQSTWGRFSQLQERNRDVLHAILEVAAKPDPKRNSDHAEDRRFLRLLHGRAEGQRARRQTAAGRTGADQQDSPIGRTW